MWKPLATIALLLTTWLPIIFAGEIQVSRTKEIAVSPWEPVARINPRQPYQVQIDNQTGSELEYASTTNEFPPRRLTSGDTALLNRLPLPIYLLISPINPRFNLKYNVIVSQNLINIRVRQLPENRPGNTTVNIQQTGGIFIY